MMKPLQQPFKWVDCSLAIRKRLQKTDCFYELLSSEIQIQDQQAYSAENSIFSVSFEKQPDFDHEMGYFWHKSWMIPTLRISIAKQWFQTISKWEDIEQIRCAVTSGYPKKQNAHYFLEEIRMEGEIQKQMDSTGNCSFANIKFGQTSFNHSRNKFSVVVTIFGISKNKDKTVIKSLISTPLLVDSRKQARIKIPKNIYIAQKIPYKKFIKSLQSINKRKMRMKNRNQFIKYSKVQDSLQNFVNYYSAANIRYKIKHPFYFGFHFPKTFRVFFNSEMVKNPFELLSKIIKPLKPNTDMKYMYFLILDDEENSKSSQEQNQATSKAGSSETEENKKKIKKMLFYNKKSDSNSTESTNGSRQQEDSCNFNRKKFQKLLQSWKFYFIETGLQSQVGTINKKWKQISRQQQLQTYLSHCKYCPEEQQEESMKQQEPEQEFELHQVINLNQRGTNRQHISTGSSSISLNEGRPRAERAFLREHKQVEPIDQNQMSNSSSERSVMCNQYHNLNNNNMNQEKNYESPNYNLIINKNGRQAECSTLNSNPQRSIQNTILISSGSSQSNMNHNRNAIQFNEFRMRLQ